jgi:hypothetical protein
MTLFEGLVVGHCFLRLFADGFCSSKCFHWGVVIIWTSICCMHFGFIAFPDLVGGRKCLLIICQDVDKNAVSMDLEKKVAAYFLRPDA